jgi:hypothetical protein
MSKRPWPLRLDQDILDEVQKISEVTNLPQAEVIRQMVAAGVRVIKANGYKLTLPLKLELIKEEDPKNSSSSTSGSGGGAGRKKMGDALGEAAQKKAAS